MLRALRTPITVAATLTLAAGLCWALLGSSHVRFRTLRLVGNQRVSETAVRHLASLEPGDPLVSLDLDGAVRNLERHPWIAEASARRAFPDTVVLQIRERQVRAVLASDGFWLVDRDGTVFHRATTDELDHPLLTGIPAEWLHTQPELARRVIGEALRSLDAAETVAGLPGTDISEVRFGARSGYTLALRNGGEILLGFRPPSDSLGQLALLAQNGVRAAERPLRIDLGSPSQAIVTPL